MRRMIDNRATRIYLISALAVLLLGSIVFFAQMHQAQGHTDKTKTVTSVYIEEGDSLWSIATEYHSDECGDIDEYIEEICKTNHIKGETIHAGNYLIVPYYR